MDLGIFLNLERARALLPWVLPPVLGALIGYVTNAIAIRMLFRPLRAVRIFGLPLPLTPGIIPKQRFELAESIGQMVSRELLTEEAVRRQLASENFQAKLEKNIDYLLSDIIRKPLSSLTKGNQEMVFESVEGFLSEALYSFFSSRSFIHGVRTIIGRVVQTLSDKSLADLVGSARVGQLVVERVFPLIEDPDAQKKISQAVQRWLEARRETDKPLGDSIPEELGATLAELIATLLPSLFESLFRWLNQEDTREELNRRGKRLLRDVLEKLNVLQRFLISAGQFDRALEQKMPEIVDEALESLRGYAYDEHTLESLKGVLLKTFEKWRSKSSVEVFSEINPDTVTELTNKLLLRLGDRGLRERIASGLDRVVERIKQRRLGEILTRYIRVSERETIEYVSNQVLTYLSKKETSQAIAAEVITFSRRFIEEHQQDSIAELLHIGQPLQKRASVYLSGQLIQIVDARLPAFIESFDVRQMVVERINNLDVAQVEKLLLMVIHKHLKWINLFGGLLGAVIGFSQLILRLLQ